LEITTRAELKNILSYERKMYFGSMGTYQIFLRITKNHPDYYAWKYIKQMRKTSYYYSKRNNNLIYSILYILNSRAFNSMGRKLGIESGENVFQEGLRLFHTNGIVVNGNARVGKNCCLYGNNCIGNDGITRGCPKIGDNVRICVGGKVLGDIEIADEIVIAAGAVVVKSCSERGAILAGIPAKIIGYRTDKTFLE